MRSRFEPTFKIKEIFGRFMNQERMNQERIQFEHFLCVIFLHLFDFQAILNLQNKC